MLDKDNFLSELKKRIIYADGAMGTVLQQFGIKNGCAEELNLSNPYLIQSIHKAYLDAGANILLTNTFGANWYKLAEYNLQHKLKEINQAAVRLAKEVVKEAKSYDCLIAADISELGEYIEPLGKLTFDDAYVAYKEQLGALSEADLIFIETISDIKLLKAAVIAAKETGKIVITSMTFEDDQRTSTGTDVKTYVKIADCFGADVIGSNCSCGPQEMLTIAKLMTENTNRPVLVKPNAGVPKLVNGRTIFDYDVETFADYAKQLALRGVNIVGGCCGTDPGFIKAIVESTREIKPLARNNLLKLSFCSRTKTVELDGQTLIIGERINPTGRKQFREELKEGKMIFVRNESLRQKAEGASLLDINVGVPKTDEAANLAKAVSIVQNIVDLPLVIDTSNTGALENALKQSDGKPVINSVNGKDESLNTILPLAKKYGAAVIALCLDEKGIPQTVEDRLEIARKIIEAAKKYGLSQEDIIIDCLTLTIATNPQNENIILETIKKIKEMGRPSILGISNISYGLPNRTEINQKFFTKAVRTGLDLAILNPQDNILREDTDLSIISERKELDYEHLSPEDQLFQAIFYGDKENILEIAERCLTEKEALVVSNILISALEEVGKKFKAKQIFLPQVLLSAEAAKTSFEMIKKNIPAAEEDKSIKIVFATVEDDIHDIGKNIVISILSSYGYKIIDLGKDVPVEKIISTAVAENADLIALSALMTTTAPQMEKIVNELKQRAINIPVIIGGAVITSDYAKDIGAAYSQDAISSVKIIKEVLNHEQKNH